MWLPFCSMLSTDLFCAVDVTPVLQHAVYWSVLAVHMTPVLQCSVYLSVLCSTCVSHALVCCLLICSTQYMWLPFLNILFIELLYAVHVAHVYWSPVCSKPGSHPLICCMQYTWLMSIDLLYAVHVAHVHWSAVRSTRGSCPIICCMQYMLLSCLNILYTDRLYALQVTPLPRYNFFTDMLYAA